MCCSVLTTGNYLSMSDLTTARPHKLIKSAPHLSPNPLVLSGLQDYQSPSENTLSYKFTHRSILQPNSPVTSTSFPPWPFKAFHLPMSSYGQFQPDPPSALVLGLQCQMSKTAWPTDLEFPSSAKCLTLLTKVSCLYFNPRSLEAAASNF